jgi:putative endonuclease
MYRHLTTAGSFAARYRMNRLVYFETAESSMSAIAREKQIKGWLRAKKIALITAMNPTWNDLAEGWFDSTIQHNKQQRDG